MPMLRLALSAVLVLVLASSAIARSFFAGPWEGSISIDGSAWAMAVTFEDGENGRALLDLPELGMFREPVVWTPFDAAGGAKPREGEAVLRPVVTSGDLELPFGIGSCRLELIGATLRGETEPAPGLTVVVEIHRPRVPRVIHEHDVVFQSVTAELRGTIYKPHSVQREDVPGVVIVGGSETGHRGVWAARRWVEPLLSAGCAVLVYDRRGEGESPNAGPDVRFQGLLSDALAGADRLGCWEGVDAQRVGLLGCSQGAWVAAAAAAADPEVVHFVAMIGAPGVTPAEQERQSVEARMRAAGMSHDDIQQALAYLGLYFFVARTGEGFDLLHAQGGVAAEASWGRFLDTPRTLEDLNWWRDHHDFDMLGALEGVRQPVLAIWGERDTLVPPRPNLPLIEAALTRGDRPDPITVVCPGASHPLELPGMYHDDDGRWVWPRLSPEAIEALAAFMQDR